jgi:hypothetical protein
MFLLDDFQAAFRNLDGLPWANHSRMAGLTAAVKCGQERRACDLYRRSDRLEGGGLPGIFRDCVYRFAHLLAVQAIFTMVPTFRRKFKV